VLVLDAGGRFQRRVAFPRGYRFFGDLAVDPQGTIFLVDSVAAVIYTAGRNDDRFSVLGESLREYLNFPTSIAVDDTGVIYLVDQHGSGLVLVGQDGAFLGRQLGMGWNKGDLYYPSQMCITPSGTIFIADRNNSRIQIYRLGEGRSRSRADEQPAIGSGG
jgi:hypothetical protein